MEGNAMNEGLGMGMANFLTRSKKRMKTCVDATLADCEYLPLGNKHSHLLHIHQLSLLSQFFGKEGDQHSAG